MCATKTSVRCPRWRPSKSASASRLQRGNASRPARPPPGRDAPPPLVGARRVAQKVLPGGAEVVALERPPRLAVDGPERVVLAPLVRVERQAPGDPLERREVAPGQIADRPLEHHRPDEGVEPLGGRAGARAASPSARGAAARSTSRAPRRARRAPKWCASSTIEQAELVAQDRHVAVGAGEGRDGDRAEHALAVAEPADRAVPDRAPAPRPTGRSSARVGTRQRRRRARGGDGRRARARVLPLPVGSDHHAAPPAPAARPRGRPPDKGGARPDGIRTAARASAGACPRAGRPGAAARRRAGSRAAPAPGARRPARPTERRGSA